jgi:hypothetical protein
MSNVSNVIDMPDRTDLTYPSPWLWRLITAADAVVVAVRRAKVSFIVPAQEGTSKNRSWYRAKSISEMLIDLGLSIQTEGMALL